MREPAGTVVPRWAARALPGVLALLALGACRFGAPEPATAEGERVLDLYRLFFYVAMGVGGIVYALILYVVVRYRRRSDRLPRQTRYNVPLEITYTAIPVLIVAWLFWLTFRVEQRVDALVERPAVVVNVTAFQWGWRFEYPEHDVSVIGTSEDIPTMVVPTGETVRVNLYAADVQHAFYVPEFLFKRDTIPGIKNEFDLEIPREGRFRGECAEYCGLNHAYMNFFVEAVDGAEFEDWLERERGAP